MSTNWATVIGICSFAVSFVSFLFSYKIWQEKRKLEQQEITLSGKKVKLDKIILDNVTIYQDPNELPGDWMKTLVVAHEKNTDAWVIAQFDDHVDFVPPLNTLFTKEWVNEMIEEVIKKGYKRLNDEIAVKVATNYGIYLHKPEKVNETWRIVEKGVKGET